MKHILRSLGFTVVIVSVLALFLFGMGFALYALFLGFNEWLGYSKDLSMGFAVVSLGVLSIFIAGIHESIQQEKEESE